MKHTEITDKAIAIVKTTIYTIDTFNDKKSLVLYSTELFTNNLLNRFIDISEIDLDGIKREFWEVCNDFSDINSLKRIYEIKFENLLNWRVDFINNQEQVSSIFENEIKPFFDRHEEHEKEFSVQEKSTISMYYFMILIELDKLRNEIISLLRQWEAMAVSTNSNDNLDVELSKFKLAYDKKTDFFKIISAMYDTRMFETNDGFIASNKEKIMIEFGKILGEDFSSYSTYLSMAKKTEKDVFMKIFKEIEKKGSEYYDKEYRK
jgi:hypothetical protein